MRVAKRRHYREIVGSSLIVSGNERWRKNYLVARVSRQTSKIKRGLSFPRPAISIVEDRGLYTGFSVELGMRGETI